MDSKNSRNLSVEHTASGSTTSFKKDPFTKKLPLVKNSSQKIMIVGRTGGEQKILHQGSSMVELFAGNSQLTHLSSIQDNKQQ